MITLSTSVNRESDYDPQLFHEQVVAIAVNPKGWSKQGYGFIPSTTHGDFHIELTPQHVLKKRFPHLASKQLSIADERTNCIYINENRWRGWTPNQSKLPLAQYRIYLINHELGHLLGKPHFKANFSEPHRLPAPVMMQQTLGIGMFEPNYWPSVLDEA